MPLSTFTGTAWRAGEVTLAHPEPSHPHVSVPILLVALGAVLVVVVVASSVPTRAPSTTDVDSSGTLDTASWPGPLTPLQWPTRVLAVATLGLVVVAGRVGADDELENLAPALTIGAGWPLLLLGCLLWSTLWRWVDPWDTLARVLVPRDASTPPGHVWPALALAAPWMWFLSAYDRPLDPRAVGTAVAVYSVVTLAGCVALGRGRWLGSSEPLGLVLSWIGQVPRRRLGRWRPPRGAASLLGLVIAGLLFGALRRTLWFSDNLSAASTTVATVGVLAACVIGAALGALAGRAGRTAEQRAVAVQVLVPALVGVALAVALARNRLFTSVQLLPGLLGDPLGRGWDLLGTPTAGLDPAPLGSGGLIALQLCLVAGTHIAAAAACPRPLVGDARIPVIGVLVVSVGLTMVAVGLH